MWGGGGHAWARGGGGGTVSVFIGHRVVILGPDLSPVAYVGHRSQDHRISLDFFSNVL